MGLVFEKNDDGISVVTELDIIAFDIYPERYDISKHGTEE